MAEWKETRLSEITTKIGSGATPTGGSNAYLDRGISLIRSQNVLDLEFTNNGLAFISDEQADGLKNVTIQEEDVLLNITGDSVARICKVPNSFLPARVNQHVAIIRADKKKTTPDYLLYYLHSIKEHLLTLSEVGATRRALTKSIIENLSITLPPLPEQEAIAEALSSLDDKIDLLHRQNKTLESMAETLFRHWFVEEAQEDWSTGTIGEYIKIQNGYAFKSKDFSEIGTAGVVKITNISMSSIDINNTDYVSDNVVKLLDAKKFKINSGDFLIAMTGAEIGKIGIVGKTQRELWLNQRVGKLVKRVEYGDIIGYLALKSTEGQEHILNTCTGSAQENISAIGIEQMEFIPYQESRVSSFGHHCKKLFNKIIFNQSQIRTLTQLRDTLLPKLMSGEVRVRM